MEDFIIIYFYVPNNVALKYKAKSEFQGETKKATVDKNHTAQIPEDQTVVVVFLCGFFSQENLGKILITQLTSLISRDKYLTLYPINKECTLFPNTWNIHKNWLCIELQRNSQ